MSGKQQKASKGGDKGYFNGVRCPLGYVYNNGVFTIIEEQAAAVRTVFDLFLHGQSLNAIAQAMNDAQAPTASKEQVVCINYALHPH